MPFEVMVVSIVAIVFGYKLLSRILPNRSHGECRKCRHPKHKNAQLMGYEEQEELRERAAELARRVRTLEEIIGADATVRS